MWSVGGISQKFFKSNLATRLLFSRGLASTLYVNGISFSSTEKTIAEAFSKYGEVSEGMLNPVTLPLKNCFPSILLLNIELVCLFSS
uniref:Uncharacterized protein MANES_11G164200 n=1 Tax=Rhizophora mucronata TaxID=61149 RepID=A0A2P2JBV0_RHIMU